MVTTGDSGLEAALERAVGPAHLLLSDDLRAAYEIDWTRRWTGRARAVVRPGSTEQVAAVLRACRQYEVPVVVRGGGTGLVGGSVPTDGEVVVSTGRLARLDPVDAVAGQVTAGAGVTVAALRGHARAAGWDYGVDLASRDSASIGGTVATNAGGTRVVRHGDTRAQVLGVEAVLADGSVIARLHGLAKDSAGYDLEGLLTGSEGTLAIVTAVRLRLVTLDAPGVVTMVGCAGLPAALNLLRAAAGTGVRAAEVVLADALAVVMRATGLPAPLEQDWPVYLLLHTDELPELDHYPADRVDAAVDPRLWAYRDRMTEAIATLGIAHKLDVAAPLLRLAEFVDALPAAVAPWTPLVFGHLAEGSLHVNIVGPAPHDDAVDQAVLRLVTSLGGTISAEHGVGRAKARWLHLARSPEEIAAMRAVKDALDPGGLLSPGVLFS